MGAEHRMRHCAQGLGRLSSLLLLRGAGRQGDGADTRNAVCECAKHAACAVSAAVAAIPLSVRVPVEHMGYGGVCRGAGEWRRGGTGPGGERWGG